MIVAVLILLTAEPLFGISELFYDIIPDDSGTKETVTDNKTGMSVVIYNQKVEWKKAKTICGSYSRGRLAVLENPAYLEFVGEAMADSGFALDSLWIGLRKRSTYFEWESTRNVVSETEFSKCENENNNTVHNTSTDRNCGAVIRYDHDDTCFVRLDCSLQRGFLCMGTTNIDDDGWITIGKRKFKIFYEKVNYTTGRKRCVRHDPMADLAILTHLKEVKKLGRYLLIGRPSLERAWIGASYRIKHYVWDADNKPILDQTQACGYPPWRKNKMTKRGGCLLLDRHASNVTYFVEAPCNNSYQYICFKTIFDDESDDEECYTFGDYDYKIYYQKKDWFEASHACKASGPKGRLAVLGKVDLKYFIYLMESNKRNLLHIWLGAYYKNGVWTWSYTNESLPTVEEDGFPPWVKNRSYSHGAERRNLCLNIDRENFIYAMFYGTRCTFKQKYICQYDKGTVCGIYTLTLPDTTAYLTDNLTTTKRITTTTKLSTANTITTNKPTDYGPEVSTSTTEWPDKKTTRV